MRRVAWMLLLLFAFAIPWQYSLEIGEPVGNIARIVGLMLLLVAVPAILQSGRMRTPGALPWLVLALYLWFCCSFFWSIEPQATLARMRGYFQEMMTVWLVWELAESPEDLRALLRTYVAGSWLLALLTVANFASPEAAGQIRFAAAGQDPNDVARFLALGFPMAALLLEAESSWAGRLLAFGYLPLGLAGVLLTASRGGFVAAVVALAGCGVLLLRRPARAAVAGFMALPIFAAGFWFVLPHETLGRIATIPEQLQGGDLNQRLNIWAAGWQAFVHAPFFGTGAGSFVSAAGLAPADTAHNTALTIVVEGGIVALMLAAAIVAVCARSVLQTEGPLRIAFGTALLVWLVTSAVATVEQNRTTWLLLGLIAVAGRLAAEDRDALARCFPGETERAATASVVEPIA
jgi:O-antigen ligase